MAGLLAASAGGAQTLIAPEQRLDFDRPEAWGMKFAAAVLTFSPLAPPRSPAAGEFELAIEIASVPSLSREERRLGFVGTKVEEIDRAPAIGRLRVAVGIGRGWRAEAGVVPPVELDGLEPQFLALGLSRSLRESARIRLGARIQGQAGRLRGDITCSRGDAAAGDSPERNPLGCEAPSKDEVELKMYGFELLVARPARRDGGFEPYAAFGAQHLDATFQVDARYAGLRDRSRLLADGWTWSAALGAGGGLGRNWRYGGELFYSPLDIRRPNRARANEPVVNLRLTISRRLG